MLPKKTLLVGALALAGVVSVSAFYAKGAMLIDNKPPVALIQEAPYIEPVIIETPLDDRPLSKEPVKVKGLYMTGTVFNVPSLFYNLVRIVDETELNAMVIDMKDDDGKLMTELDIPLAKEIKAPRHKGMDALENLKLLGDKNIYPIARIVVFKDPALAGHQADLAIRNPDGSIWRDNSGLAWVDPFNKKVWDYTVDVAREAAKLGFREIQFDYVRFPTDGRGVKNVVYPAADERKKEEVIADFLAYAKEALADYNVFIAADVFGLTTLTSDDMGIGQKYERIISVVDYVCPMVYPSHYGPYNYGFKNPNAYPYEVVKLALEDGRKKSEAVGLENQAIVRPWLQSFSLGQPKYGAKEIRAQIQAVYDAGYDEWILWNAGNKYNEGSLLKE